jgi:hypothetical protein
VPDLQVAAIAIEQVDVRGQRASGILLRRLRHGLEYLRNPRPLPYVHASVGVDELSFLLGLVKT